MNENAKYKHYEVFQYSSAGTLIKIQNYIFQEINTFIDR